MPSLGITLRRAIASPLVVFLLVCVVFGVSTGFRLTKSPDRVFYLSLADEVSRGHWNVFTTSKQANFTIIVFPTLLALARTASPAHWETIVLIVNVICAAITAALLTWLIRITTRSDAAAAIGLLFYVASYDVALWVRYVETDNVYTLMATVAFLLVIRGVLHPEGRQRGRRTAAVVFVLLAAVTRPVGSIVIPLLILTEWFFVQRSESKNRRALWLIVGAALVVGFLVHAYFFQDMSRWPGNWMRPKLEEYASRERAGEVVYDRRESFHSPPVTMIDYVAIEADRFVRFFQITSSAYSSRHNAMALAYFVPLYVLALIGVADALRGGDRRRSAVVQTALLWVVAMAALSAVTVLDFDFRYRVPLMPQLILLAACGAEALLRRTRVAEGWAVTQP